MFQFLKTKLWAPTVSHAIAFSAELFHHLNPSKFN